MIKRSLGKTGIEVSEIAFGGVEIGMPYGIGVKSAADMLSEKQAIKLLHSAMDSGINFFDTARMYGNSEKIMGEAFKNDRSKVILATKCKHLRNMDGFLPHESELNRIIETSLNESLEALQTDYVDIFMLHQADLGILGNETVSATFLKLRKQGKFRGTGVSTYTPEETKRAIEAGIWDVIQLPFNLMDQRQEAFFSLANQKGVGILIRSVLLKGLLSEKGRDLHPALKDVEAHINCFDELLEGVPYDLATLATKFALSFSEVSAILVGIDRTEYLYQSLEAANGTYLDGEKLSRAKELSYPDPGFINLPYWDKMNWLS
ncbi:MAG: aldo/keto reductase [Cytophagales bacterium]|nr:aldo/keto reductase [Cytophagales bacterium]